jgi:hypothetical protein
MANSTMLEEMLRIMSGEIPPPDQVSNRLLLAGIIELHKKQDDLLERMAKVELRQDLDVANELKNVTWPWVLANLAQPVILVVLATIIGIVLSKAF